MTFFILIFIGSKRLLERLKRDVRRFTSSRLYIRISLSVALLTKRLRNGEHLIQVMLPPCLSYSSITGSMSVVSPEIYKSSLFTVKNLIILSCYNRREPSMGVTLSKLHL